MTTQQLPERPNLEQLKHQAKDLLQAARTNDAAALQRMRVLPAFSKLNDEEIAAAGLGLHDAQSAIARGYGFVSWGALREKVEEITLQFAEAVKEFVLAATDGRSGRAERLLALHPRIPQASLPAAILLGDAARVDAVLAADPTLATQKAGAREWEPILYVCHSSMSRSGAATAEGFAAIARRLIALGADPNTRFPWLHHGVRRPVLWGAVCSTRSLPLAETLLDAGANPNDGVTLTIAAGGGDLAALELLAARGAEVNFPWATDGASPLSTIMSWMSVNTGALWLLSHGADPNGISGAEAETPLHAAARRGDIEIVEELLRRGARVDAPRKDGRTPYVIAEMSGHREIAVRLAAAGAVAQISEIDRYAALCALGAAAEATRMLTTNPSLRTQLTVEHHRALWRAAEEGKVSTLETMLLFGFDPNLGDEIGATALHRAAMSGHAEATRVLLQHGGSVAVRDKEFNAPPLLWAAEGARMHGGVSGPHAAVAKMLLAAGSPTEWNPPGEPSEAILEILAEWRRAAG